MIVNFIIQLKINNVIFKVTGKIPRCSATNLQPGTNNVTLNLPLTLKKFYNHNFLIKFALELYIFLS